MTANALRREDPTCEIVLIDREREHLFAPSLLWLLIGERRPEAIKRPLSRLERKGIRVVTGEIEHIDAQQKSVRVAGQDLAGDALVIALGADLAPEKIPGLQEAGCNLYTLEGAQKARDELRRFREGRIAMSEPAPQRPVPRRPASCFCPA